MSNIIALILKILGLFEKSPAEEAAAKRKERTETRRKVADAVEKANKGLTAAISRMFSEL